MARLLVFKQHGNSPLFERGVPEGGGDYKEEIFPFSFNNPKITITNAKIPLYHFKNGKDDI
jgi:hypothetical protein